MRSQALSATGADILADSSRSRFNATSFTGQFAERSAVFAKSPPDASDTQHVLCLPLAAVEKTLGVIYLTSSDSASPFREDHVHFLSAISRIAAVTLENILSLDALNSENQQLKEQLHSSKLVGESRQIGQVEKFIAQVAQGDSTVLIRGRAAQAKNWSRARYITVAHEWNDLS